MGEIDIEIHGVLIVQKLICEGIVTLSLYSNCAAMSYQEETKKNNHTVIQRSVRVQ